ncbi:MAG: hypothetical protein NTZ90_01355 [Proteobacteria bacterium]|nr:hypothetical protein [Pseudomonadota bacterium]
MQVKPSSQVLDKLEWPLLLGILADLSQTEDGRVRALELEPCLDQAAIETRWGAVEPLKVLAAKGLKAQIGHLQPLGNVLRAAAKGQMLDGASLRGVAELLESTRRIFAFAAAHEALCSTLRRCKARILTMPHLLSAINKAIGLDGELLDDASEELMRIRRSKIQLRHRIEEALVKLMHVDQEVAPYVQDDFFTVRSDRYVIPMTLDGRGRVKGTILDTSTSGQTLFIEPVSIAPQNAQLLDLDLEEKLEIARIFRVLSAMVEAETETLRGNYQELIELDFLTAQALLAAELEAGPVRIAAAPVIDLRDARHPLLGRTTGKRSIANHISLEPGQKILIISGPNAGGKTVVLKTVGLLHLMARAGLLLPASPHSQIYLFAAVHLEMGDAQNLTANLSTFSGHLTGLKPILEQSSSESLVLLDELAVGTDPETGAAIGTAILEDLASRGATGMVTTHFDALKSLAIADRRFRNGSMEFSLGTLLPTYRLLLDLPGQSFGLEVAEQIGLPERILTRAKELRHGQMSNLDHAVRALMEARDQAHAGAKEAQREQLAAAAERLRWQQEVELLQEQRKKTAEQLAKRYETRMDELHGEFEDAVRQIKQAAKERSPQDDPAGFAGKRRAAEGVLRQMGQVANELQRGYDIEGKLPGQAANREALVPNAPVFILPLKKAGRILRVGSGNDQTVEVEVGILKLRVSLHDVRLLSPGEAVAGGKTNR